MCFALDAAELVTLIEGQEGTDMGFFHVVPGDVGILPELSRLCSSTSGTEVCCGSCFRLVC